MIFLLILLCFQECQLMSSFFSRSRGKKTSASLEGIKEGQALETKKKEPPPPAESMKGGFTRYDIISTLLSVWLSHKMALRTPVFL